MMVVDLLRPILPVPSGAVALSDGRRLLPSRTVPIEDGVGVVFEGPRRLRVVASSDRTHHGTLLHVSLSYPDRDPPWADIKAVRAAFFPPDADVMMVLPRAEDYVAGVPGWEDSHVFHLWQTPSRWGLR